MATLTDYRADLDGLLATAVDGATWPTALKDAALRLALRMLDARLVYETSFTVTAAGAAQDLSSLTDLDVVLALAYPWDEDGARGTDLALRQVRWHAAGAQVVVLETAVPQVGEVMRVRHTQLHHIQNLDAAAATTAPDRYRQAVGLAAGRWCCELRRRQLSENPAVPPAAAQELASLAHIYEGAYEAALRDGQPGAVLAWGSVGI